MLLNSFNEASPGQEKNGKTDSPIHHHTYFRAGFGYDISIYTSDPPY